MSCIFGENRDIFFPKLSEALHLMSFSDIAIKYLKDKGYEAYVCETEDEARELIKSLPEQGKWPCLFTMFLVTLDQIQCLYSIQDKNLKMEIYKNLGVIKNEPVYDEGQLNSFESAIHKLKSSKKWNKKVIVNEFFKMIPKFKYYDNGKYLDGKM